VNESELAEKVRRTPPVDHERGSKDKRQLLNEIIYQDFKDK
jgi:hypothetical protein